jgi:TonB family protein
VSDSVYAKPVAPRIVVRPALASLALHGLLLAFLVFNWTSVDESRTVKVKPAPRVINAKLVDISEFQPRPKPKPKPKAQPKPKPKVTPAKPKPKPKVQAKPKVTAAKPKPAKPAVKPKPKPEPRITEEELARIARDDLAQAMASEDEFLEAEATASAEQMVASYMSVIRDAVVGRWSRPPSARNGMEALLQIQLIPTGEVVSVSILQGSGNSAFDNSAVAAVQKVGSFPELQNLPSREFEQNFRRFRLLFKPEDLRY